MHKKRTKNDWQIGKFFIFRCAGFPFELIEELKFPKTIKVINDLSKSDLGVKLEKGQKVFEEEFYEKRLGIQRIASLPKFQEAVFLQDIGAHKSIRNFSKKNIYKHQIRSKSKSIENLVYRYLQRFCTKNETVSFFGPFYIGDFSSSNKNIGLAKSGGDNIRKRVIFINYWFLFSIIDSIESNDKILIYLKPSIPPNVHFNKNSAIILKTNNSLNLDKLSNEIYRLADRKTSVSIISSKLIEQGFDRDEIFKRIRWMFQHSFLLSGLEVASSIESPEDYLLETLRDIPSAKKSYCYCKLKKLSRLKRLFQRGNFLERLAISDEVNRLFLRQIKDTYSKSRFYGRSFLSEYCCLNLDYLKIGKGIKAEVLDLLNFILNLASYNYDKFEKVRNRFIIDWLRDEFKTDPVSLREALLKAAQRKDKDSALFFSGDLSPGSFGNLDSLPPGVLASLDKRQKQNSGRLTIKDLGRRFSKYLNYPGKEAATCCDILISAPDIGAINKGRFDLIFSEAHPMRYPASCYNVLVEPSGKKNVLREELAGIQKYIAGDKTIAQLLINPKDILDGSFDSRFPAEIEYDLYSKSRKRRISLSDLKIRYTDKSLKLLDSKNREILFLGSLPFFGSSFSVLSPTFNCLRQAQATSRFQRARLGDFVFQREQWFFLKKDLFFAQDEYKKEGLELWLELEKWRRNQNIPKHIFLRADNRIKPIFVDFENYFAIEAFINFVKRARQSISIEEMLPGPEDLWFKDKNGRYTCEFRLILYKKAKHSS